jgi:hypothetical protein
VAGFFLLATFLLATFLLATFLLVSCFAMIDSQLIPRVNDIIDLSNLRSTAETLTTRRRDRSDVMNRISVITQTNSAAVILTKRKQRLSIMVSNWQLARRWHQNGVFFCFWNCDIKLFRQTI